MLLFAGVETWIVTIWQPDPVRHDLEWQRAAANWFAFPFTVDTVRATSFDELYLMLVILISFGDIQLFYLVSPYVSGGSAEMVFWFAQTRLLAFRIIFSFHLIALLLLMFILTCVDLIYRHVRIRAITKHIKAAHMQEDN